MAAKIQTGGGCCWSSWTTTCCSAVRGPWRWTRGCGTTRCSVRTASGCCTRRSRRRFSSGCCGRRPRICPTSTSGGWDAAGGLGQPEEFPAEAGGGTATGAPREADFHGQRRSNETQQSTTDPDARLYKKSKGTEAKLSCLGHGLMENRNRLLVRTMVTQADGTAERDAALLMAWKTTAKMPRTRRVTLGGDKN